MLHTEARHCAPVVSRIDGTVHRPNQERLPVWMKHIVRDLLETRYAEDCTVTETEPLFASQASAAQAGGICLAHRR